MTPHTRDSRIVTISKEELAELPAAHYAGNIVVVDTIADVPAAVESLLASHIVGFDTETRPSFRKGQSHKVSLLQLATPQTCYLFRLHLIGMPSELKAFLEAEDHLKVGLSLRDDFQSLNKLEPLSPAGFIDLQQYVRAFNIADSSLSRIYAILFGHRISKGQRLSNWEAETLSPAQAGYAALDAASCIQIYEYISHGQFDPWSSPYLREPAVS